MQVANRAVEGRHRLQNGEILRCRGSRILSAIKPIHNFGKLRQVSANCAWTRTQFAGLPGSVRLTPEKIALPGVPLHPARAAYAIPKASVLRHASTAADQLYSQTLAKLRGNFPSEGQ